MDDRIKKLNKKGTIRLLVVIILAVVILGFGGMIYYMYKIIPDQNRAKPYEPIAVDTTTPVVETPDVKLSLSKNLISAQDLDLTRVKVDANIAQYNLPLNTVDISNWEDFSNKVNIDEAALNKLTSNGFVVQDTNNDVSYSKEDFADYYSDLKYNELPIFITSDSLLHYYHIFFDTTLTKLERDLFYDDLWQMSKDLYDNAQAVYASSTGEVKEAAKRNVAYLAVALESLAPKQNQILTDATLRQEYCSEYMDEDTCQMMILGVKETYGEKASLKYFSKEDLNKYSITIPDYAKELVSSELELIKEHQGWENSPIFVYKEDYSQYVPRGHYTKSEKLKNYFVAMMWYGRMTALVNGSESLTAGTSECSGFYDGIISKQDAKIQTLQGSLLTDGFVSSQKVQEKWNRIYSITGFFAGFSDDLGPYEYANVLNKTIGGEVDAVSIEANYDQIEQGLSAIAYNPKIYSGLGACQLAMPCPPLSDETLQELKTQAKGLLNSTKGFRMMGQRFSYDSFIFSEIISPYTGQYNISNQELPTEDIPFTFTWDDSYDSTKETRPFTWVKTEVAGCPAPASREVRGFPTGLDVMAVLGSQNAYDIMEEQADTQYSDYDKKFQELKSMVDSIDEEEWYQNVYNNWLYVLKTLVKKPTAGTQPFMQTRAWESKQLNTALASWAELRHDTLLYVKQSYTMAELGAGAPPEPVVGYVEPVPEFYARLLDLTNLTNDGFRRLIPAETLDELQITYALDRFSEIIEKLMDISIQELENKELDKTDYLFIEDFGKTSEGLIEIISGGDIDKDALKTTMVADVHTEGNTEKVLEEGVGYVKTMLVIYKHPKGYNLIGVGPVFSYHEFKQPMADRLTDEKWREMLESGESPAPPKWTESFME